MVHSSPPSHPSQRFVALDCVRGVAAVAVVLFHFSQLEGTPWLLRGWLAVDVFFCLSGFVIAHSYLKKLEQGMTFKDFFRRRISRLYPLYFLALVCGLITFLATLDEHQGFTNAVLVKAVALGVLALPYLNDTVVADGAGNIHGALFPLNDPAWSLFFELFVNIAFFALVAARVRKFWPVILVAAVAYLVAAKWHGLNAGWNTETVIVGFPRVVYAFFVGVVLYKLHDPAARTPTAYGLLALLAMLVSFVLPDSKLISVACALLIGPLVIRANASVSPGPRLAAVGSFLGGISYPLYITHVPVYRAISLVEPHGGWHAPAWVVVLASTGVAMLAAWGAARLDEAFRAYLGGRQQRMALGSP